jgi:hypothetical protein
MLKHPTQQLMLKSEKYFMRLVSHSGAPEDTIIFQTDARHSTHTMTCVQPVTLPIAAFDRVAEIEEASSFPAFSGCFRSHHGGRGAFAPHLYDAFVVEKLFYMACGSRTYGESDKLMDWKSRALLSFERRFRLSRPHTGRTPFNVSSVPIRFLP